MSNENILVGVIGGSGLYHLDNLTLIKQVTPTTPWGAPSSPITIAALPCGARVAFLARHGAAHTIPPSLVPARANIAALKSLGVRAVLAFSAVGSLREALPPGALALPTQVLDRTKGVRPASFFDGAGGVVAHAAFGDPFSAGLVRWLEGRVRAALAGREGGARVAAGQCVVCVEGPQFSTRAESALYRAWGADLVNMSVLPEAKLAREAELSYALIATVTDYDSWRPHAAAVTAADVLATLRANADTARHVVAAVIGELVAELGSPGGAALLEEEAGRMKFSIMPRPLGEIEPEERKKLAYVLPEYFSLEDEREG